jgi:hypothetical protein
MRRCRLRHIGKRRKRHWEIAYLKGNKFCDASCQADSYPANLEYLLIDEILAVEKWNVLEHLLLFYCLTIQLLKFFLSIGQRRGQNFPPGQGFVGTSSITKPNFNQMQHNQLFCSFSVFFLLRRHLRVRDLNSWEHVLSLTEV